MRNILTLRTAGTIAAFGLGVVTGARIYGAIDDRNRAARTRRNLAAMMGGNFDPKGPNRFGGGFLGDQTQPDLNKIRQDFADQVNRDTELINKLRPEQVAEAMASSKLSADSLASQDVPAGLKSSTWAGRQPGSTQDTTTVEAPPTDNLG